MTSETASSTSAQKLSLSVGWWGPEFYEEGILEPSSITVLFKNKQVEFSVSIPSPPPLTKINWLSFEIGETASTETLKITADQINDLTLIVHFKRTSKTRSFRPLIETDLKPGETYGLFIGFLERKLISIIDKKETLNQKMDVLECEAPDLYSSIAQTMAELLLDFTVRLEEVDRGYLDLISKPYLNCVTEAFDIVSEETGTFIDVWLAAIKKIKPDWDHTSSLYDDPLQGTLINEFYKGIGIDACKQLFQESIASALTCSPIPAHIQAIIDEVTEPWLHSLTD